MNITQLKNSQFLKKEDVGKGALVTIRGCDQQNVALPGASEELKWALHFDELEKPLILNQTNGTMIASILGSQESDDWIGKKIVLYSDPTIMYAGKIIGGIRVRAPRNQPAAKPAAPARKPQPANPEPENEGDPEVPF